MCIDRNVLLPACLKLPNYAKLDLGTFLLIGIISHFCRNHEKRVNWCKPLFRVLIDM